MCGKSVKLKLIIKINVIGCLHTLLTGKLGKVSLAIIKSVVLFVNPKVMTGEEESRFRVLLDLGKLTLLYVT